MKLVGNFRHSGCSRLLIHSFSFRKFSYRLSNVLRDGAVAIFSGQQTNGE